MYDDDHISESYSESCKAGVVIFDLLEDRHTERTKGKSRLSIEVSIEHKKELAVIHYE